MKEGTQYAANIAAVVGAIAAIATAIGGIGVLWLTYRQLLLNTRELARNAAAQTAAFWLQLREMFAAHDEVHRAKGPKSAEDWRKVEAYMGLFEHCESMLRKELIDPQTFKEIYQYRLLNIMANRKIVIAKLGCNREGWQRFIDLLHMVGIEAPPGQNLKTEELCADKYTSYGPRFGE